MSVRQTVTSELRPADSTGAETLEIMEAAPRYNYWQFQRIAPFLGRRVCEVGAGIGNMSLHLTGAGADLLVLTDMDPYYRDVLRRRFGQAPNVVVQELTLPAADAAGQFGRHALDTIIALNVIEHIAEDVEAMRSMAAMLAPGGRAIVLVPALPWLYGTLDEELGHVRRYTRRSLAEQMQRAGLSVEHTSYFNLVGTLGWWMNARVRRVPRIPISQLRWFDALVPLLRLEDRLPLPLGQSVIGVGVSS
ncbi:MAG: class I SAM-dependent methyltransferase [Gemmatimonadales bacterium]